MQTYNEFISSDNQKAIRRRLMAVLKRKSYVTYSLGVAMGLGQETLEKFMIDCLPVNFKSLSKLEMFCIVLEGMLERQEKISVRLLKDKIQQRLSETERIE